MTSTTFSVTAIGAVRSPLRSRQEAPRQGHEGAPDAWLELSPAVEDALEGLAVGQEIILLTWLDRSRRDVLRVHPRWDERQPLMGVFATRSPDRPNPIGLHRVTILDRSERRLKVRPLEALDGTPILDIKPVLTDVADA